MIQPENVLKADHYEIVKTLVEVCKVGGLNFVLMCTYTVGMVMEELHNDRSIRKTSKYIDGVYFQLSADEKWLVNNRVEDICISTRLLSLASSMKFTVSKYELKMIS